MTAPPFGPSTARSPTSKLIPFPPALPSQSTIDRLVLSVLSKIRVVRSPKTRNWLQAPSESEGSAQKQLERMRADISLPKQINNRGPTTSACCRKAASPQEHGPGQLTRLCRFTGRPGKASNPKNSGRKTQKRSELPSIFVSVRTHPDHLFSATYKSFK
jgi:hypothetical protein